MNLLHVNDRTGHYPPSFYAATATPFAPLPPLLGDAQTDVAIIGAGYTGLSAALHLAQKGFAVTVLEAHRAGFGASGRNGGQVGTGQRLDQATLEQMLGREAAHHLWDIAAEAKALVKSLIHSHDMPVTFYPGIAHPCRTAAEVRHANDNAERLARDYNYTDIAPLSRAEMAGLPASCSVDCCF